MIISSFSGYLLALVVAVISILIRSLDLYSDLDLNSFLFGYSNINGEPETEKCQQVSYFSTQRAASSGKGQAMVMSL